MVNMHLSVQNVNYGDIHYLNVRFDSVFSYADGIPLTNPNVDSDFDDDFHYLFRPDSDIGSDSEPDIPNENSKNRENATTSRQFSEFIPNPPVSSYFGMY